MGLSARDRLVLWGAQHEPDVGIATIARKVKLSQPVVRRTLQRLEDRGAITRMTVIDTALLGYQTFDIYIATTLTNPLDRAKFEKAIIDNENVAMVIELGGDFEYQISLCAKSVREVSEFLLTLSDAHGDIFCRKTVGLREAFFGFGRKYLVGREISPIVELKASSQLVQIDETDHKILRGLAGLGVKNRSDLARSLGMPHTTVDYRIKQLEAKGVIARFIYGVELDKEGIQRFRLLLSSKSSSRKSRDRIFEYCAQHLRIVNLACSVGPWDYEIGVEVERQDELKMIVCDLQARVGAVLNSVSIIPILSIPKVRTYPFKNFRW